MIANQTRKTVIAESFTECRSLLSKARGLMFRKKPCPLLFSFSKSQKIPLHMLFVFFPIDVLWIDAGWKVVDIKEGFRPFSFYSPSREARYVLELECGAVRRSRTQVGDLLRKGSRESGHEVA